MAFVGERQKVMRRGSPSLAITTTNPSAAAAATRITARGRGSAEPPYYETSETSAMPTSRTSHHPHAD